MRAHGAGTTDRGSKRGPDAAMLERPAMGIKGLRSMAAIDAVFPAAMAGRAKGLPVGLIPKQGFIAFVRFDVIDDVGSDDLAGLIAHRAERMHFQEDESLSLPSFREVERPVEFGVW